MVQQVESTASETENVQTGFWNSSREKRNWACHPFQVCRISLCL